MVNLLYCEWLKSKRSKLITILMAIILSYILLMFGYAYYSQQNYITFVQMYKLILGYINFLILPVMILSLTTSIFADDYQRGILKNIFTIPVSRTKYFFSKLIYILISAICFMLIIFLMTCLISILTRFSETMTMILVLRFLYLSLISAVMLVLAIVPVSILMIITKGNSVISNLLGILYIIGTLFLINILDGISPIASAISIIWYKNSEGVQINDNVIVCLFNIVIIITVYIILSLKIIKQQEL